MSRRFLSMQEVRSRTTFSKTHLYRLINAGEFPRPVPIGPHRVAFVESEVQDWMEARIAERPE